MPKEHLHDFLWQLSPLSRSFLLEVESFKKSKERKKLLRLGLDFMNELKVLADTEKVLRNKQPLQLTVVADLFNQVDQTFN